MLSMKLTKNGNDAVVEMDGRIDANNAGEAKQKLLEVAGRFDNLTLDLAELKYISSAGLRTLKSLYTAMKTKGGKLLLRSVRPDVMEVFKATGFWGLFDFA